MKNVEYKIKNVIANNLKLTTLIIILSSFLFFSCSDGDKGTEGAAGPTGPTGTESYLIAQFQNGVLPGNYYSGTTSTVDTRIWENSFNSNYEGSTTVQLGVNSDPDKKRGLFGFNVELMPANAQVKKAYVTLYCSGFAGSLPTMAFYKITQSWIVDEACYSSRTASTLWTDIGGTFDPASQSSVVTIGDIDKFYTWEINPSIVQDWIDTPSNNRGLMLKNTDESIAGYEAMFWTSEYSTYPERRPMLTVYYTLQ